MHCGEAAKTVSESNFNKYTKFIRNREKGFRFYTGTAAEIGFSNVKIGR